MNTPIRGYTGVTIDGETSQVYGKKETNVFPASAIDSNKGSVTITEPLGIMEPAGGKVTGSMVTDQYGAKVTEARIAYNVAVQNVSIDRGQLEMETETTFQLTATVEPDNALNKRVTWESSNKTIAAVPVSSTRWIPTATPTAPAWPANTR